MEDKNWKEMFDSLWQKEKSRFIQFLLDTGLDVNSFNKFGKTMLSYAAECGNLQIAEFLLQKGADANVENSNGSKPLHIAAQYGQKDTVKFFLDRGISVDSCDNRKCTSLHYIAAKSDISSAGREGFQELAHILVNREADIDAVNGKGCTPLLLAAQNSHKDMVELFIKLGANVESRDENQWTVLHHACRRGWSGIVRTLLEGRFEIDLNAMTSNGCAPVDIAVEHSHEHIIKLLIESGADVKSKFYWGRALLFHACRRGWLEVVRSLVRKGWDLNAKDGSGGTPLITVASFHYPQISVLEYLIECGVDVDCCDEKGETALLHACRDGFYERWHSFDNGCELKLEAVKALVSKGCDLNAKDKCGRTPLMGAAFFRYLNLIEYLIDSGADVECCDYKGSTVLHRACEDGPLKVVKCLVSKGSNLNAKDERGRTPLIRAADYHRSRFMVIRYLIKCGADVESCDEDGFTVLHYACRKRRLEIVKSLIKNKCDVNAPTVNHDTPLHLVIQKKCNIEIIKHLLNAGADCNIVNSRGETAFNMFVQRSLCLEEIILFIRSGAYLQTEDYAIISNNSLLKEGILQNAQLCIKALINKFNNAELPKIYAISLFSGILPKIEELKIASQGTDEQNIAESVKNEIETKGYCSILNVRPIVLRRLCVLTLVKHYNL